MNPMAPASQSILMIGGSPANRAALVAALEALGHRLVLAPDGAAGLQCAAGTPPDLILLDSAAGGIEFCSRLKAQEATRPIPVILMTAEASERGLAFQRGADDCLALPLDLDEALGRIANQLKLGAMAECLAAQEAELTAYRQNRECPVTERVTGPQAGGEFVTLKDFAFDRVREAAYLIDENARFVYVNKEACRALGYSTEELLGMSVFDIDPGWTHERWGQAWAQLCVRDTFTVETVHRRKDGSFFPIEVNATHFEFGGVSYSLSLVRDISERKEAERRQHASEQAFRAVVENIPDAIVRLDRTCRVVYFNPVVARLYGLGADGMLGQVVTGIPFLPDAARFIDEVRQVIASGRARRLAHTYRDECGAIRWCHSSFVPEFDAIGDVHSVLVIGRDIHDLKESERRYRALAENTPDYIALHAADGRVVYLNPGLERLLALKTSEMAGRMLPTEGAFANYRDYVAHVQMVGRTGEAAEIEVRIPAQIGGPRHHHVRIVAERDQTGQIVGVISIGRDITERKRYEEALLARAELERRLSSYLKNAPGFFYTARMQPDGHVAMPFASPRIEELFGLSPDDVVHSNAPLIDLVHPQDRPAVAAARAESARDLAPMHCEYRIAHPARGERWIELNALPHSEGDGGVVWHGFMRDITARKRAEHQLALLGFALDRVREALYVIDDDFRIVHVNAEACRALGYSREELQAMTVFDIDPDLSRDTGREPLARRLAGRDAAVLESRHRARDGRIFPVEIFSSEFEYAGRPMVISLARDITERKRAEREHRLLNQAVNASSEAAFLMDARGRFVYVNDAACRSLGYGRDELLTMCPLDIDPDLTEEYFAGLMQRVLAPPGKGVIESRHRSRDGKIFPVELSASFIELEGEKFCLVMARNISERKRTEEALRFIAQRAWAEAGGESFLNALAGYLGQTLDVDYVIIDRLADEPGLAETAALYARGSLLPNIRYALAGTPCHNVIGNTLCIYEKGVQELFPTDRLLVDMQAQNYVGLPLWDSAGRPIGLIATIDSKVRDDFGTIASLLQLVAIRAAAELERERHERQLLTREQEFRNLAENSPDPIVRYDLAGRRLYVNAAFMRLTSLPPEAIVGSLPIPTGRLSAASVDRVRHCLATTAETALPSACEIEYRRDDGSLLFFQNRYVPEFGPDGKLASVLGISSDITERKQAEKTIRQLNADLSATLRAIPDLLFEVDGNGNYLDVHAQNPALLAAPREALIGHAFTEILPAEAAEVCAGALREADENEYSYGKVMRLDFAPGTRWFELSVAKKAKGEGADKRYVVLSRDITERKQAEQEHLEHLFFLECMDRINRAIHGVGEVEGMIAAVLDVVLDIFDADRAFLMHPCDPLAATWSVPMARSRLQYPCPGGDTATLPMDVEIARMLRAVLAAEEPVKFGAGAGLPLPAAVARHSGARSLMSMALYPKAGRPWNFGLQQCSHERAWTSQDERLFQEIGRRLADGLSSLLAQRDLQESEERLRESNEQLRELTMRRETAREEERKRIAREIHDELGQNLTALRMGISQLRFQFGAEHPALVEHIGDMHKLASETLQTVRHIASALRPAALDAGIAMALSWLAKEFERHARIACRLELPQADIGLDEEGALALFRVAQESLTNVARHAQASEVVIALSEQGGDCAVVIRDNGRGFDTGKARTQSFGLVGMRERAHMAGGQIHIDSQPGSGTTVTVTIPLHDKKDAS